MRLEVEQCNPPKELHDSPGTSAVAIAALPGVVSAITRAELYPSSATLERTVVVAAVDNFKIRPIA